MSCEKHKKEIAGISDMKVLAEMIGDLHYETLHDLLKHLGHKIFKDSQKDERVGRDRLSMELFKASLKIDSAYPHIYKAYEISKPFMNP